MNIGGFGNNRPINIWEVEKRAAEAKASKLPKDKLTAKPTEEQLKHLEEMQKQEAQNLKDNPLLVPRDWEAEKGMINLTKEEMDIRIEQDRVFNDIKFYTKMAEIENDYQDAMAKIDENAEINQKKDEAKDKARAKAIIAQIKSGRIVSPFDIMFANDIDPAGVSKAMQEAQKNKEGKNNNETFISAILNSIDFKA